MNQKRSATVAIVEIMIAVVFMFTTSSGSSEGSTGKISSLQFDIKSTYGGTQRNGTFYMKDIGCPS